MNRALLAIVSLVAGTFAAPSSAFAADRTPAAAGLQITAIYFDSPGADRGGNTSLNAEWVRIKNTAGSRRSLRGWTLRDADRHVYRFGAVSVAAGRSIRVHTGSGSNTASNLYWGYRWYVWNNTGDTAYLKNASGRLIDRCSYRKSQAPEAFC